MGVIFFKAGDYANLRGWILQGKIEVELQLVTAEEAEKAPVGLGRSDPEALSLPK